jgi:hypothetical protein
MEAFIMPTHRAHESSVLGRDSASRIPSWFYWVLLTASVLTGVLVSNWTFGQSPPNSQHQASLQDEIIRKYEQQARKRCQAALRQQLAAIPNFFEDAKKGCPDFADYALGWGSTRRWLQDLIPFGDCEKQKRFLQEKFAECIFKEEDVERLVEGVVKGYVQEVQQIENQMLLELRADLEDIDPRWAKLEVKQLQEEYNKHLANVCRLAKERLIYHDATAIARGAAGEIAYNRVVQSQVGQFVPRTILRRILTRLGIRGAEFAISGTVTFGVGFIAAFIVDKIADFFFDHKEALIAELRDKLDELKKDISEKVKQELEKFTEEREAVRRAALQSMLMAFKKQQ